MGGYKALSAEDTQGGSCNSRIHSYKSVEAKVTDLTNYTDIFKGKGPYFEGFRHTRSKKQVGSSWLLDTGEKRCERSIHS